MKNAQDLRLQQRAALLKRGVKKTGALFTQEESRKTSEDSIRLLSKSYKESFAEAC